MLDFGFEIAYGDGTGGASSLERRSKKATQAYPPNTWVHVAAVVRGPVDMTIYVDGQDVGGVYSGTGGPMSHSSHPARLGMRTGWHPYDGTSPHFPGALDEFSVYDRALEAEEIQAIFNAGSAGKCKDDQDVPATSYRGMAVAVLLLLMASTAFLIRRRTAP